LKFIAATNPIEKVNRFPWRKTRLIEWGMAVLMSAAALRLHWVCLIHAGGLWRDEAGGVQLALLPSLREVWAMLTHDSFPILMPLTIRSWSSMGFGDTDFGLRCLGFCVGLLLLASLWIAAGMMRRGTPVVALALAGLNITIIRAGDSLRAYGLAAALVVLVLALTWRLARKPNFINASLAALAAIFSVQCLYQDIFFVLAACCGGVAVCGAERRWRDTAWIFGVGALAAISLIPYIRPIIQAQDWWLLEKFGFHFSTGVENLRDAAGFSTPELKWLWRGLFLAAVAVALCAAAPRRFNPVSDFDGRDLILFGGVALTVSVAGFFIFLRNAGLPTQPWYFTPLIAFVAVCLNAILTPCDRWVQPAVAAVVGLSALAAYPQNLSAMPCRQTNVDIIAAQLTAEGTANDFIVVQPWYYGISFSRYYKGAAPWVTVPPLADHTMHRYDQFKVEMLKTNVMQPVLDRIAATLKSGHRVWVLTAAKDTEIPTPGSRPRVNLPPPPLRISGWTDSPYTSVWASQTMQFLSDHSRQFGPAAISTNECVNPLEDLRTILATGWQTNITRAHAAK
jgi:hypothetical protein